MILEFTEQVNGVNRPCYIDHACILAVMNAQNAPPWGAAVVMCSIGMAQMNFLVGETPQQAMALWRDAKLASGVGAMGTIGKLS